jgi:hypothetical protein
MPTGVAGAGEESTYVDVFQAAAGRKRLGPQRRRQSGVVKRRLPGALKIATQRISTVAGVGISGSSDLRKRRGPRSGGAAPTRRKRAPVGGISGRRRLGTKELGGSATPAWKKRKVRGGREAGEHVHGAGEGDLAVNGSLMPEDARTSRPRPTGASTMARPMCANGRGMQQPLELNFLSLTLISWWRMQFGECVFKNCSFP